jgi:hypothetical protein
VLDALGVAEVPIEVLDDLITTGRSVLGGDLVPVPDGALVGSVQHGLVGSLDPILGQDIPDVDLVTPNNSGDITDSVGKWKWLAVMILLVIGAWRVVTLGMAWGTGNSGDVKKGLMGVVGIMLGLYLIYNFEGAFDIFRELVPDIS